MYHVQVLNTSVEVVHAVILAEGDGRRRQEIHLIAISTREKVRIELSNLSLSNLLLIFGHTNERLSAVVTVDTVCRLNILNKKSFSSDINPHLLIFCVRNQGRSSAVDIDSLSVRSCVRRAS